jgi:hypothetical protein
LLYGCELLAQRLKQPNKLLIDTVEAIIRPLGECIDLALDP